MVLYVPSISPLALITLLLVAPKGNRHRQAWLILIPAVVVLIAWRGLVLLLDISVGSQQQFGSLLMSLATAWTAVWLLGHWLVSRYRTLTFFSLLALMIAVGALTFFSAAQKAILSRLGQYSQRTSVWPSSVS